MEDEKIVDDKNLEKELMEKIQAQYARGDYKAALALIDEYIAIIGIDKQIYLLREKIQELKKASRSASAAPGKPSELKVVSAFDELAQSSDSVEFKSAEVESSIVSTLKKKEAAKSPPKEEKIPQEEKVEELRITDEDIMELSEEMAISHKKEAGNQPPKQEEEENKRDTKPFDFQGYLKEHAPKEELQLHIPFTEDGTLTGTQLKATEKDRQEEMSTLPKKEPEPVPEPPKPKVEVKLEPPVPEPVPARSESPDKIPPADKEFVQMLETELSKSRKKPTFTPSFLKTDPKRNIPSPPPTPSPKTNAESDLFPMDEDEEPPARKSMINTETGKDNKKLFIWIGGGVLGAAVIFSAFYFSGIFRAKKSEPPPVIEETQPRPRKSRPKPQQPPPATATTKQETAKTEKPATPTPDQMYNQYLDQAEKMFNEGKYNEATQLVATAKTIKSDLRMRVIEGKIEEKILEIQSQAPVLAAKAQKMQDENDYNAAREKDTRDAYQEYLKAHPLGAHQGEAIKRMKELEKEEQKNFERRLLEKVNASRQVQLRSEAAYLSQARIQENWSQIKSTGANCEQMTINGNPVAVDYSTGLMWYRVEKPIDFLKAQFWATRRFANYNNWRLPTTDEAKTLMTIIPKLYPGGEELEIWTCDHVSQYQLSLWTLKYPGGTLNQSEENQFKYLFIVRTIK